MNSNPFNELRDAMLEILSMTGRVKSNPTLFTAESTLKDIGTMAKESLALAQPDELPSLGEADPQFAINDQGAEYLAAIGQLEEHGQAHYLGWYMVGEMGQEVWWASKNDFMVRCPSAADLVTAVYSLEQAHVTDASDEPPDDHAYERNHRDPHWWRTDHTQEFVELNQHPRYCKCPQCAGEPEE